MWMHLKWMKEQEKKNNNAQHRIDSRCNSQNELILRSHFQSANENEWNLNNKKDMQLLLSKSVWRRRAEGFSNVWINSCSPVAVHCWPCQWFQFNETMTAARSAKRKQTPQQHNHQNKNHQNPKWLDRSERDQTKAANAQVNGHSVHSICQFGECTCARVCVCVVGCTLAIIKTNLSHFNAVLVQWTVAIPFNLG